MEQMTGPLVGLRVLDLSTVVAAPFAATLLGDLGADVIKIELPDGRDPLRTLPPHKEDIPLWWKVTNRNKRGVTLDVRTEEGKAIFLRMIENQDVLVENFRTGTMDRWGLDAATLRARNPRLTILRVTGFGQTGPYKNRRGFARLFEALSGITYITGPADRPPTYCGFPVSDAIAGLFGTIGILAALVHARDNPDNPGQDIDLSATEAMFRLLDFLPIEYDQLGVVRERTGNQSGYNAPVNTYLTADKQWLSLHASVPAMFARLCALMGRPELPQDPRFSSPAARMQTVDVLDKIVGDWVATRPLRELCMELEAAEITHAPIYSIKDIFEDPQFQAREALVTVQDERLGPVRMQCPVPRFSDTPVAVRSSGPDLGQHNEEIYRQLGIGETELASLRERGVV